MSISLIVNANHAFHCLSPQAKSSKGRANGTRDARFIPARAPMVFILPLTTQVYPSFKRLRIMIEPRDRLLKPCRVIVDQPRALDKDRFGEGPLTCLTTEEMTAVELSLKGVLGVL